MKELVKLITDHILAGSEAPAPAVQNQDEGPQPEYAVPLETDDSLSRQFSDLPAPAKESILSSIPPRKLTEDEALDLLMDIQLKLSVIMTIIRMHFTIQPLGLKDTHEYITSRWPAKK